MLFLNTKNNYITIFFVVKHIRNFARSNLIRTIHANYLSYPRFSKVNEKLPKATKIGRKDLYQYNYTQNK